MEGQHTPPSPATTVSGTTQDAPRRKAESSRELQSRHSPASVPTGLAHRSGGF